MSQQILISEKLNQGSEILKLLSYLDLKSLVLKRSRNVSEVANDTCGWQSTLEASGIVGKQWEFLSN